MEIKLYNSLANRLDIFKPLIENEVSMYVCGSTVYDSPHIGNLRPIVSFDVLRRLFIYLGYKVTYVSNYTDVDDKIINKAIKEKTDELTIANRYIKEIDQLISDVNSLKPDYQPRVTEYMDKIISFIDQLVKNGNAYLLDGDVYFRVNSIKGYGELSNINIEELKVGARIEDVKGKESPLDFALWKKTDKGIKWDSPWGLGRPGWHTECCVMIDSLFPKAMIDIHGGGFDLKFPHHENEIAQNKALHDNKLANYWIHNGFVTFDNSKMSKSLGNVILAKDAVKKYGGNVVRLALLSSHYRSPVKFNKDTLTMAKKELDYIVTSFNKLAVILQTNNVDISRSINIDITPFVTSLANDLNVSNALTNMYDEIKKVNTSLRAKTLDLKALNESFAKLKDMIYLLGLNIEPKKVTEEDLKILNDYKKSREDKDFSKSDLLRKELIDRGLI